MNNQIYGNKADSKIRKCLLQAVRATIQFVMGENTQEMTIIFHLDFTGH